MEELMDFLEDNGFAYSELGVDVMKVTKGEISFAGYRMQRGAVTIIVGNKYVSVDLPDSAETLLFKVEDREQIWSVIEAV